MEIASAARHRISSLGVSHPSRRSANFGAIKNLSKLSAVVSELALKSGYEGLRSPQKPTADVDHVLQYISSYDGSAQAALEASSTAVADKTARINTLVSALDHYYTNSDTSSSLYSSDDDEKISDEFNSSRPSTTFPEILLLGMAARESGANSDTFGTDNGIVSGDYGHGIMQLTVQAKFPDIKYLQIVLNLSSSTQVASSGAGSPGHETNAFGTATENAVEEFQTIYGLTDPSGFVGTSTLAQLNLILASDTPASIPSGWQFVNQLHYTEEGSDGFDNRTFGNGLSIPPCGVFDDPSSTDYFENCYINSTSSNGYATDTTDGILFQYYNNSPQSIYANIKGALKLLRSGYATTSVPTDPIYDSPYNATATVYSGTERSWFTDMVRYNGGVSYLSDVADQMNTFVRYKVGGVQLVPTSTQSAQLYDDLHVAADNYTEFQVFSPVDPVIVDSQGREAGLVNGQIKTDIPGSVYDPDTKSVFVLMTDEPFTYKLSGEEGGTYGVQIVTVKNGKKAIFNNLGIPIQTGEIHSYTLDFNKLLAGQKGVTMDIDTKGNGTIDKVETFGATTTEISAKPLSDQALENSILNAKTVPPVIVPAKPKVIITPRTSPIIIPAPTSSIFISSSSFNVGTSSLGVDSTTIEIFSTSTATSTIINSSTNQ